MPRPEFEPMEYLSKRGRRIFFNIIHHVQEHQLMADIDTLELSMLANAYDVFERCAQHCNDQGYTGDFDGKNGTYKQIIPEYSIMKQQYDLILKHSPKFGLTPGDRLKVFKGIKKEKKKDPNEGLD